MAKQKALIPKVKAEAVAKAELVAKATYQRKHTTTEVIPPDVTRARTAAWLDIISPITEWAALKGDALWYRRQLLRIQQEASLEKLANTIHRKMNGRKILQPLPPKILVPALEGVSLEDAESPLIEWWANLLVSSATGNAARPYFLDLMKAIGPEEASCLSAIWRIFSANENYRSGKIDPGLRTIFNLKGWFEEKLSKLHDQEFEFENYSECLGEVFHECNARCERDGVLTQLSLLGRSSGSRPVHVPTLTLRPKLLEAAVPLEVCFALKLLHQHEAVIEIDVDRHRIKVPEEFNPAIGVSAIYPSKLGSEFLQACSPTSRPPKQRRARKGGKS